MAAIEKATGERAVNCVGYCLGGTLLASTLAYLAAKGNDRVKSATYFVTLVDFVESGDMSVFIDTEQLTALEARMNERGYLDAQDMATSFNMLRANDLIWSFVVGNYLLGKEPVPFDLLYWNSDATRNACSHALVLLTQYVSGEQSGQTRRHHSLRHANRSAENYVADVYSGHKRRSYRTLEISLSCNTILWWSG
jgi:polyhydroxyalkanoate synthase